MIRERYENEVKYERRIKSIHLWAKYYSKKLLTLFPILSLTILTFLYIFVLSPGVVNFELGHYEDGRSVSIDENHIDYLENSYNPDLENAYCLFGYKNDNNFSVEEVTQAKINNRTEGSVNFDCYDMVSERKKKLIEDREYKLIGDIHTHPPSSSNSLSYADAGGTVLSSLLMYELRGVYHKRQGLEFYTSKSLRQPLPLEVR